MNFKPIPFILAIIALALGGCGINVRSGDGSSPTPLIITATLPPTPAPRASETLLPPPLRGEPTIIAVEGIASTQLNVRAQPSTASDVLGIIPANTKVEIVGKDPGGNWWQINYQQGVDGKGWVTAQYVTTAGKPEVPIVGGDGGNPNNGNVAIIQQQINVRSGPGTDFNSIGTLNAQDVVPLTGRDANGTWLQIEFAAGPEGKGWINAAFVQAKGVDLSGLPIVTEAGVIVGTGTPANTPLPPTPTLLPAWMDGDSAESPAVKITLSSTGTRTFQYSSDVSTPQGDTDDWIQFIPYSETTLLELYCEGNEAVILEVLQDNVIQQDLKCGESKLVSTVPGVVYVAHVKLPQADILQYARFTLWVRSVP